MRIKKTLAAILSIVILVLFISIEPAMTAETISFQGFLADDTGSPVPDGSYSIRFTLFDDSTGGTELWSEMHPSVQTSAGQFQVQLGSIDSISTDILEMELLALELQVGTDVPMTPRIILTSSPRSRVSSRIFGDIRTTRSSIWIHPPEPGCPDSCNAIRLVADSAGNSFQMYSPPNGPSQSLSEPVLAINSTPDNGLSIRGFNPQPEPPAEPGMWFEMNTTPGGGPSLVMFNPQPEPPANPWLEMMTGLSGPVFKMTAEQTAVAEQITDPMLEMNADSIGPEIYLKRKFLQPTGGPDSSFIHLGVDSTGAEMTLFGGGNLSNPAIALHADQNGGKVSIGTSGMSNILTIQQFSSTDPIADAWTTYSSRRWKTDIRTLDHALDKVMALRGVAYKWKENGKPDIGLIAEEVGEVVPEVVAYEDNGVDAKSVDYSRLVALLIEATKEQQATIDDMQKQIQELKSQLQTSDAGTLADNK